MAISPGIARWDEAVSRCLGYRLCATYLRTEPTGEHAKRWQLRDVYPEVHGGGARCSPSAIDLAGKAAVPRVWRCERASGKEACHGHGEH